MWPVDGSTGRTGRSGPVFKTLFLTIIIKRMSILLDHKVRKILVDTKRNVYFSWNLEQLDFIVNLERDLDCMMNSMGFTDDLDFLMSTIN